MERLQPFDDVLGKWITDGALNGIPDVTSTETSSRHKLTHGLPFVQTSITAQDIAGLVHCDESSNDGKAVSKGEDAMFHNCPATIEGRTVRQYPGLILSAIILAAWLLLAGHARADDAFHLKGKPKVVFLYDYPRNDGGYIQAIDEARQKLEKEFKIDITFVENVPNNDATKLTAVVDRLTGRGFNLIVGSAFGFSDTFKQLSGKYPRVAFIDIAGTKRGANLGTVYGRSYESQYLCGMAAAFMSKSGKLGYVAPIPLGNVNWSVNAYLLGARQVNPKATVTAVFTGSWNDPVKERAAASALLDEGADVIGQGVDTPTPQLVAQERGAYGTGMDRDFRQYAPKATLCSSIWVWDRYLSGEFKKIFDGTWTPNPTGDFVGIAAGGTDIACCNKVVPREAVAKIDSQREAIIKGKQVFAGPLVDRDGKERVPAGSTVSDGDLWKMNWYLNGVTTQEK